MQEKLEPTLVRQLQDAADQGRLVEITPAPTTPPARARDETSLAAVLCLLFKLTHSEGRLLVQLLTNDCVEKEELCAALSRNARPVTVGSIETFLCTLRAKLRPHDVHIITVNKMGYGLHTETREKIYQLVARHDAGFTAPPDAVAPKRRAKTHVNRTESQVI